MRKFFLIPFLILLLYTNNTKGQCFGSPVSSVNNAITVSSDASQRTIEVTKVAGNCHLPGYFYYISDWITGSYTESINNSYLITLNFSRNNTSSARNHTIPLSNGSIQITQPASLCKSYIETPFIEIESTGGTKYTKIIASGIVGCTTPTFAGIPGWFTIETNYGYHGLGYSINAAPNITNSDRSAIISYTNPNQNPESFVVYQKAATSNSCSVNLSTDYIQFETIGGTQNAIAEFIGGSQCITSDSFQFLNVPDWLTVSSTPNATGAVINVSCYTNYYWPDGNRNAEIICVIPSKNIFKRITVHQKPTNITPICSATVGDQIYNLQFDFLSGSRDFPINFNDVSNCSGDLVFTNVPSWVSLSNYPSNSSNPNSVSVTCAPNQSAPPLGVTPERQATIYYHIPNTLISGSFAVRQAGCSLSWYPDDDLDGYGNYNSQPTYSCAIPFPNAVGNNLDKCPNTYSVNYNGCETFAMTSLDKNSVETETKDIAGTVKSHSIAYFNDLGKNIQNQAVDLKTNRIWASQTLYDSFGRPALNTLSAPINKYTGGFNFSNDFMVDDQNGHYTTADFETTPENPKAVGTVVNTLGWYYSNKNTDTFFSGNSNQDITSYPFSRSIYSKLNPGSVLKTIGGNKQAGEWKQGYSFTMPASNELSQSGAFNDISYKSSARKILKTITRDVHNYEQVLFTDTDGKTLATARVGGTNNYDNTLTISTQGYVDIHVPQGITGFNISNTFGHTIEVYDMITEQLTTISTPTLPSGFYRVAIANLDNYNPAINPVTITYKDNYYDYSLNYYDYTGRLVLSKQPLNHIETTYSYDTFGQLVYTESPDEGESWFKYRKDGQIRFSQNSKQKSAIPQEEFSYTNYDDLGRPIESGVIQNATFSSTTLNPDDAILPLGIRKEQIFTTYDYLASTDTFLTINNLHSSYNNPSFLAGNVAKTANENATTYYSYDVYGRVKWVVQNNIGLGIKTIDYEYDPVTSAVTKVYFQRYTNGERFIHRYTYNTIDQNLEKVETSIDDNSPYTTHANYKYYETGALKRTEIAPGTNGIPLQGIDYVYNLNGQLKSINHPKIGDATKDPGKDTTDFFGMSISYNNDDYLRSSDFSNVMGGINQFNGNIKGIAWNTKNTIANNPVQYTYKYNKNNWLTDANFNGMGAGTTTPKTITIDYVADSNATLAASDFIVLTNGMNIKAVAGSTFRAQIVPETTTPFATTDYAESGIEYDANGNILRLKRNKNTENGSNAMDDLSYEYYTNKPNQLKRVQDAAGDIAVVDDIGNQTGDNYSYNSIGQLTRNNQEDINYFYNTQGLVIRVDKGANTLVKFFYNERGQRIRKESYSTRFFTLMSTDYYVLDLSGNTLAIYNKMETGPIVQKDLPIFGQSRLGVYNRLSATSSYEITDHLGNVRAVVQKAGSSALMSSYADYYPFGEQLPYRNSMSNYRYAFQGQEVDTELGMEAFQLRLWDGRIGRWLSPDPYHEFHSPYIGMGNNPVNKIDPDGGCTECPKNASLGDSYNHSDYGDVTYNLYANGDGYWSSATGGIILDDVVITRGVSNYNTSNLFGLDYSRLPSSGAYGPYIPSGNGFTISGSVDYNFTNYYASFSLVVDNAKNKVGGFYTFGAGLSTSRIGANAGLSFDNYDTYGGADLFGGLTEYSKGGSASFGDFGGSHYQSARMVKGQLILNPNAGVITNSIFLNLKPSIGINGGFSYTHRAF